MFLSAILAGIPVGLLPAISTGILQGMYSEVFAGISPKISPRFTLWIYPGILQRFLLKKITGDSPSDFFVVSPDFLKFAIAAFSYFYKKIFKKLIEGFSQGL